MKPFEPLVFPAWARWKQRGGIDLPQPEGRGPNGRRLCCWCAVEVPKRRTTWCSDEHSRAFLRVFSWGTLRQYIHARDGGLCVRCREPAGARWQVDHIRPVRNGGTDDPENLRLLCHTCHVAVGYEQRRDEKAQSHSQRQRGAA